MAIIARGSVTISVNNDLDFQGDSITPPENPRINWYYYNTSDNTSYTFDGSTWQPLVKDGASPAAVNPRGIYDEAATYHGGTDYVESVVLPSASVLAAGDLYFTKPTAGDFSGQTPSRDSEYWDFKSGIYSPVVASGLVLAQEAYIANLGVNRVKTLVREGKAHHAIEINPDGSFSMFDEDTGDKVMDISNDSLSDDTNAGGGDASYTNSYTESDSEDVIEDSYFTLSKQGYLSLSGEITLNAGYSETNVGTFPNIVILKTKGRAAAKLVLQKKIAPVGGLGFYLTTTTLAEYDIASTTATLSETNVLNRKVYLGAGDYRIIAIVGINENNGSATYTAASSVTLALSAAWAANLNLTQIGRAGLATVFNGNNMFRCAANANGEMDVSIRSTGSINMPGVLLKARVHQTTASKPYGFFSISEITTTSLHGATHKLTHNIGHEDYSAIVTPIGGATAYICQEDTDAIYIYADGTYNLLIIGNN